MYSVAGVEIAFTGSPEQSSLSLARTLQLFIPATEYMQCSLSNIQGMSANENYHVVIPALVYEVKLIWRKFQDPVEASKAMLRM